MEFKSFRDVMRKDVQYRRSFLIKLEPVKDVPSTATEAVLSSDIEAKLLNLVSDKGTVEAVIPFSTGVFFICFKSSLLRDTFIVENWNKLEIKKMVQVDIDNEYKDEENSDENQVDGDVPPDTDVIDAGCIKNSSPDKTYIYKLLKFNCIIIPGYPVYSIRFYYIFEGKGNEQKIDAFVKRVTGSKDGVYTVVRQKTMEGTLTGALLVHFQNEDARNHALRSLNQLKVSYNGNEVKYEEFKYED